MLRWRKERKIRHDNCPDLARSLPFEVVQPDTVIYSKNPSTKSITWFGHSTVPFKLFVAGKLILTDPHFADYASPVTFAGPKRYTTTPIPIAKLPHIDYILISHDHYDHLDGPSLKALIQKQQDQQPHFLVPLGYKKWLQKRGATRVTEMDWWETFTEGAFSFHNTPVQHWTRRTLLDHNRRLWSGWAIETTDFKFYFTGDSGYTDWFKKIGEKLGPFDVSAIPIGAYNPRWFMKNAHMDVAEAIETHKDLGSRFSIGIHWGTFILTDEPLREPPQMLQNLMQTTQNQGLPPFVTFKHGQTKIFR
ncbi:MAG: MBL fold metallo-hydrolase [Bdellovibrionota bacterium]